MSRNNIPARPYVMSREKYDRVFAWLGPVSGSEFYGVRNELLAALRKYGSVGPMGEYSVEGDCGYLEKDDPGRGPTSRNPVFFVVSDWYYKQQRWHRVEADVAAVKIGLFADVISLLQRHEGWEVYFALRKGGLLVSADEIGYEGEFFKGCRDLQEIEARCGSVN